MMCHRQRLLYLHPTKTGGTSIERWLLDREGLAGQELAPAQRQVFGVWTKDNRQHWPAAALLERFPFLEDWRKVVTVRCPYARACSEFRYQLERCGKQEASAAHRARDVSAAVISGALWRHAWEWHSEPQVSYWLPGVEVIRLEHLEADFRHWFGEALPYHKNRTGQGYADELSEDARQVIRERFAPDFEWLEGVL